MKKARARDAEDVPTEHVPRHTSDHVTEAMDQVCAEINSELDLFVSAASRRVLERIECDFPGIPLVR